MQRRIPPKPGQESVWDYPRPPRIENLRKRVRVELNGVIIADSTRSKRVLETSHPPTIYIPPEDVKMIEYLRPANGRSFCEFKGEAHYFSIVVNGDVAHQAAWCYTEPSPGYEAIRGYVSFYPSRVDHCYVDDELVRPQAGDFYGGWITSNVVGPFKGAPGTVGW
jgi:uncharacterized protein (DUF427 family)